MAESWGQNNKTPMVQELTDTTKPKTNREDLIFSSYHSAPIILPSIDPSRSTGDFETSGTSHVRHVIASAGSRSFRRQKWQNHGGRMMKPVQINQAAHEDQGNR
jgi:hypothetical protein